VVVNQEGWIVTAAHIATQAADLTNADISARNWEFQRAAIKADTTINAKERDRRLAALGAPQKKTTVRAAAMWGTNGSRLTNVTTIPEIDLAVGRLDPFDPSWVSEYPVFKDPTKNFQPASSLCLAIRFTTSSHCTMTPQAISQCRLK
jgi:hypothetical protein